LTNQGPRFFRRSGARNHFARTGDFFPTFAARPGNTGRRSDYPALTRRRSGIIPGTRIIDAGHPAK
jgi:hypothetical protein